MPTDARGYIDAGLDAASISDSRSTGMSNQVTSKAGGSKHRDVQSFEQGFRAQAVRAMATVIARLQPKASVDPLPMVAIDMLAVRQVVFKAK